jgi:hypothetical protein
MGGPRACGVTAARNCARWLGSLGIFLTWAAFVGGASARSCDDPTPVRFPAGVFQTEISGGLARGELGCWRFSGRHGQWMAVSEPHRVSSNIVMQIYRPGWSVTRSQYGTHLRREALPGAAEGQDAKAWTGVLPSTGTYLLVVGTAWGGGSYRIRIEIH